MNALPAPELKTVTMDSFVAMKSLSMVSEAMHGMDDAKKTALRKPKLVAVTTATEEPFHVVTNRGRVNILVIPRYPNAYAREVLFDYLGVRLERDKTVRLTHPVTGETYRYSPIILPANAVRLVDTTTLSLPIIVQKVENSEITS